MAIYKPRSETSEETNPADILTLDFQPPALLFKLPSLYFVRAVLVN